MAVVTATGISFRYEPTQPVIERLSFSLGRGKVLHLRGPNGSGKTTLLKLMARVYEPEGGHLDLPRPEEVGWMPDTPALLEHLTLAEHLELLSVLGRGFDHHAVLERVGLRGSADVLCGSASFGMRRRLSFGIATALPRRLLLLDEPFNGIDTAFVQRMERIILDLVGGGTAVVVATHADLEFRGVSAEQLDMAEPWGEPL